MQKNKTLKSRETTSTVFLLAVLTILTFFAYTPPLAQAQTDPGCDPEYFESLQARAWLEAQREITQNQNLITKPDSVLEYTCFDLYLNELADHAKDLFSETRRWGNVPGTDQQSMDNALQALTGDALEQYIEQNFEDDGDGGTYDLRGGRADNVDHVPAAISGNNAQYQCDIMRQVWQQAKCGDFIENETHDGFFTFDEYRDFDDDHRFLPMECPHVDRWEDNIDIATVDDETPWEEDDVNTFLDILDPDVCARSGVVSTGFNVYRAKQDPVEWQVCIAPGCTYDPDAGSTVGTATVCF